MANKVKKITMSPTRSVELGPNKGWVTLSAGIEIEIDPPVSTKSKALREVFKEAREIIREQFAEQYKPYERNKEAKKSKEG